jgi:hypothetical protein
LSARLEGQPTPRRQVLPVACPEGCPRRKTKAPAGFGFNFMKTVGEDGWFGMFRLYAPTEAYFDRGWKLSDLVRVK